MTSEISGERPAAYLPNESELVLAAANDPNDESAFGALYDFYFPRVYSFVCRRVGHRQETEDIVSEVFLKAVVALPKLARECGHDRDCGSGGTGSAADADRQNRDAVSPGTVKFGGWLYRVAVTTVIDRHRQKRRRPTAALEEADLVPDSAPGPEESTQKKQEAEHLEKIIARLPRRDQEILYLKYFAQMGNDEIAAALGVTPNAAGVQIHRALKKAAQLRQKYV